MIGAGIDRVRAGAFLSRTGVCTRGGVHDGDGRGEDSSRRELDLRRPKLLRVRGGRTLVEDARWRVTGGARVAICYSQPGTLKSKRWKEAEYSDQPEASLKSLKTRLASAYALDYLTAFA